MAGREPTAAEPSADLRRNAVGLPAVLMQGVTMIAPTFSILSTLAATVALAGLVTPWAFLFGGILLVLQAVSATQLAKEFPSAGGWYTWVARTLHPRMGFIAGWLTTLWWPWVPVFVFSFLSQAFLDPSIQSYYGVTIPWWLFVIVGVALVAWWSYAGIVVTERLLLVTGGLEILIMLALAVSALASPGSGGLNLSPFDVSAFSKAPDLFLGIVFSVFVFSGWESTAPLAQESRNPRRNIPRALVGSILLLVVFFVFTSWGYLVGLGTDNIKAIASASTWPVGALAHRLWGGAGILVVLAAVSSSLAVSLAAFTSATRTWYAMGRSGALPTALGKVSAKRQTPANAIHAQVGISVVAFVLVLIFGAEDAFFTWGIAYTLGLILLYIISNVGVVKYYWTEGRARFNWLLHVIIPVVASVIVGYVGYRTIIPLPPSPEKWAPVVLGAYLALGIAVLVYLQRTGRRAWLTKAQLAMGDEDLPENAADVEMAGAQR